MNDIANATGLDSLKTLKTTARMPVLFLGHGSPMNAIEDNEYRRSWQTLGAEFGTRYPKPQLILCISAHWLTQGWWLTGMAQPKTIHDFGGFTRRCLPSNIPHPARRKPQRKSARRCRSRARPRQLGWTWPNGGWTMAAGAC